MNTSPGENILHYSYCGVAAVLHDQSEARGLKLDWRTPETIHTLWHCPRDFDNVS